MNCSKCPHLIAIKKALAPCQVCECGKLHGQVSVDSTTVDWAKRKSGVVHNSDEVVDIFDQMDAMDAPHNAAEDEHLSDEARCVTALPLEQEDRLRSAMSALFNLDPIELLLVQHVMHGGSYASFSAPLYDMLKRLRPKEAELAGRKEGFRSLAHSWSKKLAKKLPQIVPVLKARIEEC